MTDPRAVGDPTGAFCACPARVFSAPGASLSKSGEIAAEPGIVKRGYQKMIRKNLVSFSEQTGTRYRIAAILRTIGTYSRQKYGRDLGLSGKQIDPGIVAYLKTVFRLITWIRQSPHNREFKYGKTLASLLSKMGVRLLQNRNAV
ncbi:hypothetical protein [Thioclava sp. ES.031]|uniref:hypothetical protein n=1 Tax=Thioclava sp. ES.031 TaxID=1798203 RepID=UPI001145C9FD|nr:hypothetical protein [Thioclava sp. ES.031]